MNLVSLLIAPAVIMWSTGSEQNDALRISIAVAATVILIAAVAFSKRKPVATGAIDDGPGSGAEKAARVKTTSKR